MQMRDAWKRVMGNSYLKLTFEKSVMGHVHLFCMGNLIKEHLRELWSSLSLVLTKTKPAPQHLENYEFRLVVVAILKALSFRASVSKRISPLTLHNCVFRFFLNTLYAYFFQHIYTIGGKSELKNKASCLLASYLLQVQSLAEQETFIIHAWDEDR